MLTDLDMALSICRRALAHLKAFERLHPRAAFEVGEEIAEMRKHLDAAARVGGAAVDKITRQELISEE